MLLKISCLTLKSLFGKRSKRDIFKTFLHRTIVQSQEFNMNVLAELECMQLIFDLVVSIWIFQLEFLMIFLLKELYGIGGSRLKVYKIMN